MLISQNLDFVHDFNLNLKMKSNQNLLQYVCLIVAVILFRTKAISCDTWKINKINCKLIRQTVM